MLISSLHLLKWEMYIYMHIYVYTHKHTDMEQWYMTEKKLQNGIYIQNGPILRIINMLCA